MTSLSSLTVLWREQIVLRWYRRALKEISPLHPDVPYIVRRIAHLEARKA